MISSIASKVVKKLIDSAVISDTEQELYLYGFFVLISQILYFTLTIIFGIILDIVLESVVFYIAFQFIRRYAGGIHASSELKCAVATTTSIFLCLFCVKLCETSNIQVFVLMLTALSSAFIFVFCPLDTPEKPLTEKEYKYFRKISRIVLMVLLVVIIVCVIIKSNVAYSVCFGIILESFLLIAGRLKRFYNRKYVG